MYRRGALKSQLTYNSFKIKPSRKSKSTILSLPSDTYIFSSAQGAQHSILRWTHRTRFQILPGTIIPNTDGPAIVDPKWVGTVVVEAEGTNEGLADLLGRCGDETSNSQKVMAATGGLSARMGKGDAGRVFRILRAKRCVTLNR